MGTLGRGIQEIIPETEGQQDALGGDIGLGLHVERTGVGAGMYRRMLKFSCGSFTSGFPKYVMRGSYLTRSASRSIQRQLAAEFHRFVLFTLSVPSNRRCRLSCVEWLHQVRCPSTM